MTEEKKQVQTTQAPAANPAEGAEKKVVKAKKKKAVRQVPRGNAYVQATYNNTLGWSSSGIAGFKGPKKATPYAASVVVKNLADKIADYGVKEINVFIKGIGGGREGAVRALHTNGFIVISINDVTPIPHNGCRAPKKRRV